MMQNINSFIVNQLDSALQGTLWTKETNVNIIGNLGNNYAIYKRERQLSSVLNVSSSEFSKYQSLKDIMVDDTTLLIACDSEWVNVNNPDGSHQRYILSWQFAFIRDDDLVEVIFLAKNLAENKPLSGRLDLLDALSVAYCLYDPNARVMTFDVRAFRQFIAVTRNDKGDVVEHKFKSKKAALAVSSIIKTTFVFPKKFDHFNTCLLFHTGFVDITAFDMNGRDVVHNQNLLVMVMKKLTSIHGGLVSLRSMKVYPRYQGVGNGHCRLFPVKLRIRDTLLQAPPKQGSLEQLGNSINVPKVSVPESTKARMDNFLINDPVGYFEYASTDSVVTLLYASSLYGINVTPKVTITSAAAGVMRNVLATYLGVDPRDYKAFDKVYRGLRPVSKGNVSTGNVQVPYIQAMSVEPINLATQQVQYMASFAYHGGYNGCSEVGYFTNHTNDYDLKNAYPTAMALIPDIDWTQPIKQEWNNQSIPTNADELFDASTPMQLLYASVKAFKFPQDTAFPCIPVVVKGIPIYPLEYDSSADYCEKVPGVYITGPELYLAHKLGAEVIMDKIYKLSPLSHTGKEELMVGKNARVSHSLAKGVKSLIEDRAKAKAYAKAMNLKNYLPDTILKVMVNSCYGKVAQNVIAKRTWDAYTEEMTNMGASFITNPVSASLITAIVRCVLIAAQNQCIGLGYHVYSVTTDGFISDVPEEVLTGLDLFGFTQLLYESRMFLTNNQSGDIWEIKHQQNDLLNFTTRGNVSLDANGVLARNGVVTGFEKSKKDSYDERLWVMDKVLTRKQKTKCVSADWVKFKDFIQMKAFDFDIIINNDHKSMDFDMKRKPVHESMVTVKPIINGKQYEIANFNTVPYTNIGEYKKYNGLKDWVITERKKHPGKALRTLYDWDTNFFVPLKTYSNRPKNGAKKTQNNASTPKNTPKNKPKKNTKRNRIKTDTEKDIERKIRACLYAHRAGVISIPLLAQDVGLFLDTLNDSDLCKRVFTKNDYKNYLKRKRWPLAIQKAAAGIETDSLQHFLEDQEPVFTFLMNLSETSEI